MPVLNGSDVVQRALDTLTRQSYANIEILISDNYSDAATVHILQKFAAADSRVRLVRQPKRMDAITHFRWVFEQCKSEYFLYVAHDDLRDDNYIEALVDVLRRNPRVSLACGNIRYFNDHERFAPYEKPSPYESPEDPPLNLRLDRIAQPAAHFYGMYRRDALEGYPWYVLAFAFDQVMLQWLMTRGSFEKTPATTLYYWEPLEPKTVQEMAQNVLFREPEVRCVWETSWAIGDAILRARNPRVNSLSAWVLGTRFYVRYLYHMGNGWSGGFKKLVFSHSPNWVLKGWTFWKSIFRREAIK